MTFHFKRWDIEILIKVGEKTIPAVEDKVAFYLQRIIANARSRGVKPASYIDALYGEDDFGKQL